MATVKIIRGMFRQTPIKNKTFTLLRDLQTGKTGKWITVDGQSLAGLPSARIKVKSSSDYEITGVLPRDEKSQNTPSKTNKALAADVAASDAENAAKVVETDAQVQSRIRRRFEILNQLTLGAMKGDIRAMFVVGAPGVGKTFGVQSTLESPDILAVLEDREKPSRYKTKLDYTIVTGRITAVNLYIALWNAREKNHVLVIDDSDDIFRDENALNLLKAALDTKEKRMIHWNVDSFPLRDQGIDNKFQYEGSMIFISNVNFKAITNEVRRGHISALMSRAHYLDLTVHTEREKMLRIEDVVVNQGMLQTMGVTYDEGLEVMDFVRKNASRLNELSIRMVVKLIELVKARGDSSDWQEFASVTMCDNKFTY